MGTLFQFPYRTVAEVSIRSIIKNLVVLRSTSQKEIVPVVKADAYGHGLLPVAKALVSRGSCHSLCVATLEEAIELRKKIPYAISIWVLSGFLPHQLEAYLKYRLTPVIHSLNHLKSLINRPKLPDFHLKLDSGMHRLGLLPDEMPEAYLTLQKLGIKLSGFATHFAESENLVSKFVDKQIEIFHGVYQELLHRKLIQTDAKIHISNTGGILRNKLGLSYSVRPGLGLYGISPNPRLPHSEDLVPALTWKARVIATKNLKANDSVGYGRTYIAKKKEKIAIVAVGYADGVPRLLSSEGSVIVGGKKAAIRGRVSMDLIAIDCSHHSSVKEGSLVTLIGKEGKQSVTAWDIANWSRTIPYEILCGISPRVPRVYLD
ncbi:MAG: alanine racemase [Deltaproteobacteria bacterium]|nr:alanine racemase [Deltaproteobacteria bacterium]